MQLIPRVELDKSLSNTLSSCYHKGKWWTSQRDYDCKEYKPIVKVSLEDFDNSIPASSEFTKWNKYKSAKNSVS